jgi:hypothetical protein
MPAVSKKQEKFMQAVAHNKGFAKKVGVSQSVGREFTKGNTVKKTVKKYQMGGMAMPDQSRMGGGMPMATGLNRAAAMSGRDMPATGRPVGMKKGGGVDGCAVKGKTKGTIVKMASGGLASGHKSANGIATKGKTKGTMIKMAKGGKC